MKQGCSNCESLRAQEKEVNRHIGRRIRERRVALSMTQVELAQLIGVTYQQVHKYETGVNRVAAGRLYDIAEALGVGVDYFYSNLDSPTLSPTTAMFLSLVGNLTKLNDEELAAEFGRLVRAIAEREARA